MEQDVQIPGEEITLAGQKFILPPMPLVKMPTVKKAMEGGDFTADEGRASALAEAIYWSLRRNYKDTITLEFVQENLDLTNFSSILDAFMRTNKFVRKTAPGEATASQ